MLLKLVNPNTMLSISCWDYGISDDIDIWDEQVYQRYSQGIPGSEFVSASRVEVKIKNGKTHAIRVVSNMRSGNTIIGNITYAMFNDGNLYTVGYSQQKRLTTESSTKEAESILNGLYFK